MLAVIVDGTPAVPIGLHPNAGYSLGDVVIQQGLNDIYRLPGPFPLDLYFDNVAIDLH